MKQKGFSLVEGLLIVLVLAVVGFGGYYVWDSQQEDDETPTISNQEEANSNEAVDNDSESVEEETSSIPEGWVEITDSQTGFTFSYPSEWGEISVTKLSWPHDGEGYSLSFSNSNILGMIADKDYMYTGGGRGGASWEFGEVDYQKIVQETQSTVESSNNFIITAFGDCVSYGAVMIATYDLSNIQETNMSVLRYSSPPSTTPTDCSNITQDNVLDYFEPTIQENFSSIGSLI
jgi:cytoskeletal protein RodZ